MVKKWNKEQGLMIVLAIVLVGIVLFPLPKEEKENAAIEQAATKIDSTDSLEKQLKDILEKISGVGKVEVLITYEDDGKRIVEKDLSALEELVQEEDSSGGTRVTTTNQTDRETVYDKNQTPYVVQELSPTIQGVLVVAQGAGNQTVKNQILETMEALFGLDAHKISIMKMEVSR